MQEAISNTPYDDVYKTMYTQCDELILPLLNEVFGEHYTGKEKIIRRGNVHYETLDDGSQDKRETDSYMEVHGESIVKYHMECESSRNGDVMVRMFRYGTHIAIDDSEIINGELYVRFPQAAVMFLRRRDTTPDVMKIHVEMPSGESIAYPVRALKIQDYDIDEIFEKRLYFLIPFYIFRYESRLQEYEENADKLNELKQFYVNLLKRLEKQADEGDISAIINSILRYLSSKVIQNLTQKQEKVRKGMGDIMGGQVLDLEVFKIRNEGIEQGIEQGQNTLVDTVNRLRNGESAESIIASGIDERTVELAKTIR